MLSGLLVDLAVHVVLFMGLKDLKLMSLGCRPDFHGNNSHRTQEWLAV